MYKWKLTTKSGKQYSGRVNDFAVAAILALFVLATNLLVSGLAYLVKVMCVLILNCIF